MLSVDNLKKTYRTRKKVVEAVKGVSFSANEGEVFAILGPNGAGKTTTIKSILGLVVPDEGEIRVNGIDAKKERKKALKMMSAVLEGNRNIHWRLSIKENMYYFGALKGMSRREIKSRMEELVERFGLSEKLDQLAGQLSRGFQQKVALAIALLPDTPIILLDEPTLGLDVESSVEMRKFIKELAGEGKLVLLSSHDMNLVESVSDRVMIIKEGRVIAMDRTENLKEMFRRRSYRIVLEKRPSNDVIEKLGEMVRIVENGDRFVFDVDLTSSTAIYDVFDVLKEEKPPIKSIETEEIDFEQVFLKIVKGERS